MQGPLAADWPPVCPCMGLGKSLMPFVGRQGFAQSRAVVAWVPLLLPVAFSCYGTFSLAPSPNTSGGPEEEEEEEYPFNRCYCYS